MAEQDLFQISHIVPDFQQQFEDYRTSSDATRRTLRNQLGLAYGPAPRQKIDLFFPPGEVRGAPIHMFIHGGYWRAQVREDYAFVADGVTAAGAICAIVEYTLMPAARLADLVREIRAALAWLAANARSFGGDGSKLSASGHSAGGHLVTYLAARAAHEREFPLTPIRAVIAISGIFDLRPITTSYLQPELQLTAEEVAHWSPVEAVPSSATHFEIVVGHEETAPFHQQAQDYAYVLGRHGVRHERVTLHGEDHMSVVRKLGRLHSPMWALLRDAIETSKG